MGTIGRKRDGSKYLVINRDLAKYQKGKDPVRTTYFHEKAHSLPVVGNSEILAHVYGGIKGKDLSHIKNLKRYPMNLLVESLMTGAAGSGLAKLLGIL